MVWRGSNAGSTNPPQLLAHVTLEKRQQQLQSNLWGAWHQVTALKSSPPATGWREKQLC